MGKGKMLAKSCPKCELQVAVATKSCKCGHSFHRGRTRASLSPGRGGGSGGGERRRTGRVRRARPHFYDSQDYQRQRRKVGKRRSLSRGSPEEDTRRRDDSKDSGKGPGRRRPLKLRRTETESASQRAPAPPAAPLHPALLQEINRKLLQVNS